ncbi:hypothetical protein BC834DRAFT_909367 [Gloeopeniophorella convolvens]|nr:hypothetical protein BC834DRAFT_909367 [Gloeopeniophorella convolvens]
MVPKSVQMRPTSVAESGLESCESCWSDSDIESRSINHQDIPHLPLSPSSADLVHDAYRRLTYEQLYLFCSVRSLPTTGNELELACRLAHHDLRLYPFPPVDVHFDSDGNDVKAGGPHTKPSLDVPSSPDQSTTLSPIAGPSVLGPPNFTDGTRSRSASHRTARSRTSRLPPLPVEVMAEIMDHVGDWELSKAVGLPTSLPQPLLWARASSTDHALLTGYLPLLVSCDPTARPPTSVGARLVVRFSYIHILSYIFHHYRAFFPRFFRHHVIPITAAHNGRIDVLNWWQSMRHEYPEDIPAPDERATIEAIDGASRTGEVASLDWWLASGLPFEYTEAALENASAKNQLGVLEWWRAQRPRLALKVGRVMDSASAAGHVGALAWWAHSGLDYTYDRQALYHASCHGRVDVLQWWLGSGLQLFFDQDVLVGATRHDRPEVLDWWDRSGLPVQYRLCDVEEALEDAIGGGERAREWWKGKGVDFNANDKEWMKLQSLN